MSDIAECCDGILVSLDSGALFCLDKDTGEVIWSDGRVAADNPQRTETYSIFVDGSDCVWIYSVAGIWRCCLPERTWEAWPHRGWSGDFVRTISQDSEGAIWFGMDRGGIEILEPDGTRHRISSDMADERSLRDNTISVLWADDAGSMWVGTYKTGLSLYNECIYKFVAESVGDVNCVEEAADGGLWLGTNGSGLIYMDSKGAKRTYRHSSDPGSISNDVVVCLLLDSRGRLWTGTFWGGINCFAGGRFIHYDLGSGTDGSSMLSNVWSLVEDSSGNIWAGTLGGGLVCFDPATGTKEVYSTANTALASDFVNSVCLDRSGNLMVGTTDGVSVMNLATRTLGPLPGDRDGRSALQNHSVVQLCSDSRNLLWAATLDGLYAYDPSTGETYDVPLEGQTSGSFILGLVEDKDRNIWASVGSDLVCIMPVRDPKAGTYSFSSYFYSRWDGLPECNFNQRSLKCLSTGEVVAGSLYGLARFRPDLIMYNRSLPRVMFTGLRLFNEDIEVGETYGGKVVIERDLNDPDCCVRLKYRQNAFTVKFASDNYVLPGKTRYWYRLDGFSSDWIASPLGVPQVTYTNLSPGTYTLRVKAVNGDGYAGVEEAHLKIVVSPPFWMSTGAYVFYALLFIALIVLIMYIIRLRERRRFKIRQAERDAQKTEELNQMKSKFFTNVSHELRTPLTLIISPLETMIGETTDEGQRRKLDSVRRNAERLLQLVNQLLDFRKSSEMDMHLNLYEGDIVIFVRNICDAFLELSEKRDMHLTFFSAIDALEMQFDEDKMGKVVTNLLSNAFKFTPEGGRVDVSLSCPSPYTLEMRVSDTGCGISDEDKEHVFDRFYRVESEENHTTGTGIGLSLVQDFVKLHGGEISVLDNAGGGTVFSVRIPIRHSSAEPSVEAGQGGEQRAASPDDAFALEKVAKPVALVVDDSADLVSFLSDALSLYFNVRTAYNGAEAWESIRKEAPDIIVSDLMMPQMDGNELCRLVRSDRRTSRIPFILLTAKNSLENKLEGLSLGADDYVAKPFNVELLILRMRRLVELTASREGGRRKIDPEPEEIEITSLDEKLVEKAIRKVEEHISEPDFSVEQLSSELGMSRVQLYKKLLRITGKSPLEFIRVIRLKRAVQYLRESQLNVSEVAYRVGFNSPRNFAKYFKEEFG
ncbi:MAG: response regulator, partial [Bacteroidales bacterium]|nr:response regulator [Bacteroidales bacterium]